MLVIDGSDKFHFLLIPFARFFSSNSLKQKRVTFLVFLLIIFTTMASPVSAPVTTDNNLVAFSLKEDVNLSLVPQPSSTDPNKVEIWNNQMLLSFKFDGEFFPSMGRI